ACRARQLRRDRRVQAGTDPPERLLHVRPEDDRVVVALVEGQPRDWSLRQLQLAPRREQRALAVAGRSRDDRTLDPRPGTPPAARGDVAPAAMYCFVDGEVSRYADTTQALPNDCHISTHDDEEATTRLAAPYCIERSPKDRQKVLGTRNPPQAARRGHRPDRM